MGWFINPGNEDTAEADFPIDMLIMLVFFTFCLPVSVGGYRRFCTEEGRKLRKKEKMRAEARKDSRKVSVEVGKPK